jgi:hypothetical protein
MESLDPQLRALLAEHRAGGRMPQDRRDAAWERLQRSIADEDRSEQTGPPGHARRDMPDGTVVRPSTMSRAGRRWVRDAAITALLAAAALLLIVSLKSVIGRTTRPDGASQAVHGAGEDTAPVPTTRRDPAPGAAPAPADPPAPLPTIAAPAPDPAPRAVRPTAPRPADDLAAELALLRRARAALTGGTPAEALPLLDEFERRFGAGHLAEEGALLRVQALCDSGARARARAAAEQLVRRFPDSPHAPTAARVCADQPTDGAR